MLPYYLIATALTALSAWCVWRIGRAGSVVHVGATEAGLQLGPAEDGLDPFDPRWRPVVWEQPALYDALTVLAGRVPECEFEDMSFTGTWNRRELLARVEAGGR